MSDETWPCYTCGHPIRRRENPKLGQPHYEHVYPVDNLHGYAVRGPQPMVSEDDRG